MDQMKTAPVAFLLGTCLILLLQSCAIMPQGPKQYEFEKARTVSLSQQQVMEKIIGWCVENEFTVENSSLSMIYATSNLNKIQGRKYNAWDGNTIERTCADCGEQRGTPFPADKGQLSVSMTKIEESKTLVRITFSATPLEASIIRSCNSNGKVEAMIFEVLR